MKLSITSKGDYKKTSQFLMNAKQKVKMRYLEKYGEEGVRALMENTPIDTGETARSWYYEITYDDAHDTISIDFRNSHIVDYVSIALILQYGHGTGTGGFVQGTDYINPAIRPVFDDIAKRAWTEVVGK